MRWGPSKQPGRSVRRRRPSARPALERLECRTLPDANPLSLAPLLPPDAGADGSLTEVGRIDWYRLDVRGDSLLTADLMPGAGSDLGLRLTLARGDGRVLATS